METEIPTVTVKSRARLEDRLRFVLGRELADSLIHSGAIEQLLSMAGKKAQEVPLDAFAVRCETTRSDFIAKYPAPHPELVFMMLFFRIIREMPVRRSDVGRILDSFPRAFS